jgi:hypothetical protein
MGKVGVRFRPFSESVEVSTHSYSRALQRVICDFGADHAFGTVNQKLKEHYGISVPTSAARKLTEMHAEKISAQDKSLQPKYHPTASIIIAESDGSMVPIVETYLPEELSEQTDKPRDRRKYKRLFWKEARLSMAHANGSMTPVFAGTMDSVEIAGQQLVSCVHYSGATENTQIHCVGDGARWIANQVEEKFGSNAKYLIDFYHLCEYLCAAVPYCSSHGDSDSWLKKQKNALKSNQHASVLRALQPYLEAKTVEDAQAPVRACYRYIKNRPEQLDYKTAIEQGLPIGSGEIESAHRYVLQKRLKLPGAWWTIRHAKNIINLRTCRANHLWDDYWKKVA